MNRREFEYHPVLAMAVGFLVGLTPALSAFGRASMVFAFAPALIGSLILLYPYRSRLSGIPADLRRPLALWGVGIAAAAMVLAVRSLDPGLTFSTTLRTLALGLAAIGLFRLMQAFPAVRAGAEVGLAFGAACASIYCLSSYFIFGEVVWPLYREGKSALRIGLAFKAYASVIPMLTAALLCLAWQHRTKGYGYIYLLVALAGLLALVGNGSEVSHSALMGLLAAFGVILLAKLLGMLSRAAAVATLAVLSLAVAAGLVWVFEILRSAIGTDPYTPPLPLWLLDIHRQAIWGFAWSKVLESPFLGWGVNTINMVPGAKILVPDMVPTGEFIPSHPHNFILEFLGELGIPLGLGLIGFLLATALALAPRPYRTEPARWGVLAVMAAFWTASISNFSIWSYWWLTCMAVTVAIVAARFEPAARIGGGSR